MALSLRAASGGNSGSTTTANTQTITLPTGATTGDLVYFVISAGAVISAPTLATGTGWNLTLTTNSSVTGGSSTIVGYKTLDGTGDAPTIGWATGARVAWTAIALQPAAGATAVHSGFATVLNGTTAATSFTANSFAAGTATGASVILNGAKASATGTTAITTAPPTTPGTWLEPTNGDTSTAVTTGTRQQAAEVSYRLAQTGTIAPGAETTSVSSFTIATHAFAVEANAYTRTVTDTAGATDSRTQEAVRQPTVRAGSAASNGSGNAATVTATVTGAQAGDTLVAIALSYQQYAGISGTGWTTELQNPDTTNVWMVVYSKPAVSGNNDVTISRASDTDALDLIAFAVTSYGSIETHSTNGGYSDTSLQLATVTPGPANDLLVGAWGTLRFAGGVTLTPPGDMTTLSTVTPSGGNPYWAMLAATRTLTGIAATGDELATADNPTTDGWTGALLAIKGTPSGTDYTQTVTDTAGATDSTAVVVAYAPIITDAAGAADSQAFGWGQAVTDTAGAADSLGGGNTYTQAVTDTAGATDSRTQVVVAAQTQTDLAGATDSRTQAAVYAQTVTDAAGATDGQAAAQGRAVSVTDTAGATDSLGTGNTYTQTVTDTAGANDTGTAPLGTAPLGTAPLGGASPAAVLTSGALSTTQAITDTAGATDSTTVTATYAQATTDTAGAADSLTGDVTKTVTDAAGAVDSRTQAAAYIQTVTDAAGAIDTFVAVGTDAAIVTDAAGATDATTQAATYSQTVTEAAGATDSLTTASTRTVTDAAGATDSTTSDVTKTVTDTADAADSASSAQSWTATLTDTAGAADSATTGSVFTPTVTDAAGATDSRAQVSAYAPTSTDPAGAADSTTLVAVYAQTVTDAAGATDTAATAQGWTRTQTDTAGALDSASGATAYAPTVTDTAGAVDALGSGQSWTQTLTDSADTADTATLVAAYARTSTDTGGAADSTVGDVAKATTDTAGATDSTSLAATYAQAIVDTAGAGDTTQVAAGDVQIVNDAAGVTDSISALATRTPTVRAGSVATNGDGNTASTSVTVVANAGDTLLAIGVTYQEYPGISGSGWTTELLGTTANNPRLAVYSKPAVSGSNTVTVTRSDTDGLFLIAFAVSNYGAVEANAIGGGSASTSLALSGVNPNAGNDLLVGVWATLRFAGAVTPTPPAALSTLATTPSNAYWSMLTATQTLALPGDTGAETATTTSAVSDGWTGALLAIQGVPSGIDYAQTVTDAAGAADSTLAAQAAAPTLTDVAAATDSQASAQGWAATATDTAAATDATATVSSYAPTITDTAPAGSSTQVDSLGAVQLTITDTVAAVDDVTPARAVALSLTDAAAIADAVLTAHGFAVTVADVAALADAVDSTLTQTEFGDATRTVTDAVGVTDAAASTAIAGQPGAFFAFLGGLM